MKYIVYLTKNIVNNKIYIGVHETEDPDVYDYYLGEGSYANKPSSYNKGKYPFHFALMKYGPSKFRRVTLKVFDTLKEALYLESILVDEKFIKRKDTYNVALGGGMPPNPSKKVFQYDKNGVFIAEYKSMETASKETGSYIEGIRNAIKLKRTCNNFYWTLEKFAQLELKDYSETNYRKKVIAYNEDLLPINEFSSISEAAKFFEFDSYSIVNAILEKHKCHGIYFVPASKTIDEFVDEIKNMNRVNKIKVYSYDIKSGDFVKEYESIKDAAKDVGLKVCAPIFRAIKMSKTSGGYRWSYYKVDNVLKEKVETEAKRPKQIEQIDDSGNIVKVWDIIECRKLYPNVIKVCRGARKKAYGFAWRYVQQ